MSGDTVERLRHVAWLAEEGSEVVDLATTAADEIARLRVATARRSGGATSVAASRTASPAH